MNRHARRAAAAGAPPQQQHAGNVPRQQLPPRPQPLPFDPAPVIGVLLRKLGATPERPVQITAADLAENNETGQEILSAPRPDGGLQIAQRPTKQKSAIVVATRIPEMSPAMAKMLGQGG